MFKLYGDGDRPSTDCDRLYRSFLQNKAIAYKVFAYALHNKLKQLRNLWEQLRNLWEQLRNLWEQLRNLWEQLR
ncbi:MAG: hypothetical protein V7L21_08185, partial [Nostoc sp.]|uniref:hypothetical protein n=1 Tax=Nostoc sp. TaxID=1180 RepID=UPI002FF74BD1